MDAMAVKVAMEAKGPWADTKSSAHVIENGVWLDMRFGLDPRWDWKPNQILLRI